MTLHRLPIAHDLLARKGAAVPAEDTKTEPRSAPADTDPAEGSEREAAGEPFQLALVSFGAPGSMSEAAAEPPPAASLLPFALHRKGRLPGAAAPRPDPAAAPGDAIEGAGPAVPAEAGAIDAEPDADVAKSAGPVEPAKPAGTVDSETATVGPLAVIGRDPIAEPARAAPWGLIAGGAAACLSVVAIAWIAFRMEPPAPGAQAPTIQAPTIQAPAIQAPAIHAPAIQAPATQAPATQTAAPAAEPRETAADPAPSETPPPAAAPAPKAAPETPPETAPVDAAMAATVDVVRIDETGAAVIAGRAAPHREFIVLDNGTPIGTVQADAFGEWVFVPSDPLADGDHEFGLVPKSVTGTAVVPAARPDPAPDAPAGAPRPAAPASGTDADAPGQDPSVPPPPRKPGVGAVPDSLVVPVPPRKPAGRAETPAASEQRSAVQPEQRSAVQPDADFAVQLASVKTRAGAEQEWQKLQRRLPGILDGMSLSLHEAKLAEQGTVIRVRTGPFVGLADARDFCARIRAASQECLVVRTGGDGAAAN